MKNLRQYIRNLILEALDPVHIKPVRPEDFNPPGWSTATEPKTIEKPQKRIGNFFMSKASDGMPARGYGALRTLKNFYMILPDGEAVRIDGFPGDPGSSIQSVKEGVRYLKALNANVTILPVSDIYNPTEEDKQNLKSMQNQIMAVARGF